MADQQAWIELGEKLLATCEGVLQQAQFGDAAMRASNPKVLAMALLCRTVNNYAALRLLIECGFVVEARTMARCCYENWFWIAALKVMGQDFVDRMIEADGNSKLKRGNDLLEWAKKQSGEINFVGPLKDFLDSLKETNTKLGNLDYKSAAAAGRVGDGYIIYRVLSADAAHPSITSLDRHLILEDDRDPPMLTFTGPPLVEDSEAEETLKFGCSALLGVCLEANRAVGGTMAGAELVALTGKFRVLDNESVGQNRTPGS